MAPVRRGVLISLVGLLGALVASSSSALPGRASSYASHASPCPHRGSPRGRAGSFHAGRPLKPSKPPRGGCPQARRKAPSRHTSTHGRPHRRALPARCQGTELRPAQGDLQRLGAAILCLVNRERVRRGERPLRSDRDLQLAAQRHTESMAFGGYFGHLGPRGQTPVDRVRAAGYLYSSRLGYEVAENIAWGSGPLATPAAIVSAWMASPDHRQNILDPHYRDSGVGVSAHLPASLAAGRRGAIYTQDFGVLITG